MTTTNKQNAAGHYAAVNAQTGVAAATPHRLIQMLLDGAISKIAMAKGAMQRGDIQHKGNHITSASSIILGLRDSLDIEAGGEIARNLDDLYDYMARRLMQAHAANDLGTLDEVSSLLHEIRRGWSAIPLEAISGGQTVQSTVAS
jgi:flagellar protein FliS